MITEGQGRRAPSPRAIRLTDYELRRLKDEAEKRAEYRGYRAKNDTWSNGLKGDVVIPGLGSLRRDIRAIFAGLCGEHAVSIFINKRMGERVCTLDLKPRRDGDFGIDLSAYGLTLQIKTRQTAEHGNLIRRVNKHGYTLPMRANAFAFCQWDGGIVVRLLGWQWTKDIEGQPTVPAIVGEHRNIVVPDDALECMTSLADNLTARKEFARCH